MATGSSQVGSQITPPPRLTGATQQDMTALSRWFSDVYSKLALTDLFVRFSEQFSAVNFDPSSLPDPASATIASAQETANQAYTLAANALNKIGPVGQFTVSDAATTGAVTFDTAQPDTSYFVAITGVAYTGTPGASALVVAAVTKTATGFTATLAAAPGAGNSVTFDYVVRRA